MVLLHLLESSNKPQKTLLLNWLLENYSVMNPGMSVKTLLGVRSCEWLY